MSFSKNGDATSLVRVCQSPFSDSLINDEHVVGPMKNNKAL